MKAGLSPILSRTLASALLMMLAVLSWSLLVLPLMAWFEGQQSAIEHGLERISRYETVAKRAGALRAWSGSGDSAPIERFLYAAETPALATAHLQRDVDTIAGNHGIILRNAQGTPESERESLITIAVRTSFSASYRTLMPFLADLSGQDRLIRVTELRITTPIRQTTEHETELKVDLEVMAFIRKSQDSR